MSQAITTQHQGPHSDASIRREGRHARGERGGMVDLTISRERGVWSVHWNAHTGRGWYKGWTAKFRGQDAEEKARAFADAKWVTLTEWLGKLEPVLSGGASAAFSTQVASMMR